MPKIGYFGTFWISTKNKNPSVCRRGFMWAVQDSNLRPPGCKLRAEHHFSSTYKITDSYQTLLNKNRGIKKRDAPSPKSVSFKTIRR